MKTLPLAAAALLALSLLSACGSDDKKESDADDVVDALQSIGEEQANLPKCEEITALGRPVDAAAVAEPKGDALGVCNYTDESGEVSSLSFMWAFRCEDGSTLVYSKENMRMGFDGETWQEATEEQIDRTQAAKGCWGEISSDATGGPSDGPSDGPSAEDTAAASGGALKSACNIYATMKFTDDEDEEAATKVWALRDDLSGAVATLADAHHKAWANSDYEAAYSLPSLWPAMQKQCAKVGVEVQDSGWDY